MVSASWLESEELGRAAVRSWEFWLGELNAYLRSRFVSQKFVAYLAALNQKDLTIFSDLMQSGKVTPVIDRTYKLMRRQTLFRYLEQGHARGKVVITVE